MNKPASRRDIFMRRYVDYAADNMVDLDQAEFCPHIPLAITHKLAVLSDAQNQPLGDPGQYLAADPCNQSIILAHTPFLGFSFAVSDQAVLRQACRICYPILKVYGKP